MFGHGLCFLLSCRQVRPGDGGDEQDAECGLLHLHHRAYQLQSARVCSSLLALFLFCFVFLIVCFWCFLGSAVFIHDDKKLRYDTKCLIDRIKHENVRSMA